MARAENVGLFDHTTNFLDVAGSLNDWGGSNQLFDDDADLIFVSTPPALAPANGTIQYKFRIDASWSDATCEFPAGGPNREYTVLDTTGGVVNALDTVWYNNIALFVESVTRLSDIMIYPNPASDVLYIENAFEVREIRIMNILGQMVLDMPVQNKNFVELNTSDLKAGVYMLCVYGENGYKGTAKFIIK